MILDGSSLRMLVGVPKHSYTNNAYGYYFVAIKNEGLYPEVIYKPGLVSYPLFYDGKDTATNDEACVLVGPFGNRARPVKHSEANYVVLQEGGFYGVEIMWQAMTGSVAVMTFTYVNNTRTSIYNYNMWCGTSAVLRTPAIKLWGCSANAPASVKQGEPCTYRTSLPGH